jgi:hypothetical protein
MGEGDVVTTIQPGDEHWSQGIIGEDHKFSDEQVTAMQGFESFSDFHAAGETAADWRRGVAGDDDKYYADLQRFSTPLDYGNSFREAQQTIRSGQLKAALGPDATEEDVTAYREANGIPLESKGYMDNLPEGLVIGEGDKEIFENFMGALHEENVAPSVAHKVIEWYNGFAEDQQDIQAELDEEHSSLATTELRESWGPDYRANINLVGGLLEGTFGKEAKDQLMNGRFGDGKAFMNDPLILKGFAEMARKLNPVLQLTPPGQDPSQTLNDEIAELEKFMSEHRTEYNKDVPKQERLKDLYQIRIDQNKSAA